MIVGDKLAEFLVRNGIEYVYGVPGLQTLPFYEGVRKLQNRIQHVLMRDERSAGYAADAYARLTGRVGVCDATVGPGATNLVSPLAEAYCSSIPLLAIISDIPRAWEHRRIKGNASQGIQQLDMFRSISKWQVTVTDPGSLEHILDYAFRIATTGKPGPVIVSIPEDVCAMDVPFEESGDPVGSAFPRFRHGPDPEALKAAVQTIMKAQKPLIVAGGGTHISGAYQQIKGLTEHLKAPVITTISGKGIIPENHPQAFGVVGTYGNPVAGMLLQQADLVFFIGSKVGQLTTMGYSIPQKDVRIIHLDIDPEEIGRNFKNSIPLLADARSGLEAVINSLPDTRSDTKWDFRSLKKKHRQWYAEQVGTKVQTGQALRPQAVMDAINQVLTEDDVVVCDASFSSGWAACYLELNSARHRFLAPRGLAGLGWSAPAAIGAALSRKKKDRIICIAGDGGFSYSAQELEVMNRLDLPVLVIVLNNDALGYVKVIQKLNYKENYISADFSHVDFAVVAKGFGARGYTAGTLDELQNFLSQEKSPQGPALIDVISDKWENPLLSLSSL